MTTDDDVQRSEIVDPTERRDEPDITTMHGHDDLPERVREAIDNGVIFKLETAPPLYVSAPSPVADFLVPAHLGDFEWVCADKCPHPSHDDAEATDGR